MQAGQVQAEQRVPFDDRGLAYGDGLFETVLVRDGKAQLWDEHLSRLERGAEALCLAMPPRATLDALPERCGAGLSVLKLIVTRGSGGRGYRLPAIASPRLRWQAQPFTPSSQRWQGVRVRHCELRLGLQPRLAGVKHLNRLENVLARSEWQDDEIAEGLLCDSEGRLTEATAMNLIWYRRGRWETPALLHCGVAGTLRAALLQETGLDGSQLTPLVEVEAKPGILAEVDALCLINSVQGVWPVLQLDSAYGSVQHCWKLNDHHLALQRLAHPFLGYPVADTNGYFVNESER
ncbi:aminodeoxychorismate lyase [Halomonas halocynthiae]|uniref:aminodeoxychorismate lyase n=1 Tax=Halomonas halocynthiae TaxID=176290 RepID=UPI000426F937|nr:aminodeoxychorismate lyase [Halomonas halocynthiae]